MAQRIILYWRDIPAQVIVRKGRANAKREMPGRFGVAIDACAMRVGAKDSDAYLAEWRKGEPEEVGDDLESEAQAAMESLDARFDREALKRIVAADGWDS